jgi:hypothetical protein
MAGSPEKRPKDHRLIRAGLLTAIIVLTAGVFFYKHQEKQNRKIEALRKEIEAATHETARRSITPEQRKVLVERLQEIHGPSVFVVGNAADEETAQYAREIGSVLKEAGWDVPPSFGMIFAPVIMPGQNEVAKEVILGVSPEVPEHIANAFLSALQDGGIPVSMGPHWPGTEHPISILVGPKSGASR